MTTPAKSMPASLRSFTDAASDIVAREIATIRREAHRERELREAEHRARLADLEVRLLAASDLERRLTDRLATLKDGEPGAQGEPGPAGEVNIEVVQTVVREVVEALPPPEPGRDGKDADPVSPVMVEQAVQRALEPIDGGLNPVAEHVQRWLEANPPAAGEKGEPGQGVDMEALRLDLAEQVREAVAALPVPADGKDGADGRDGHDVADIEVTQDGAVVEIAFTVGEVRSIFQLELPAGPVGEQGPCGADGKLSAVRAWSDEVHYVGDIVTFEGATYQASRDTGRPPSSEDWVCLAARGSDGAAGRSFDIMGTWDPAETYSALNVVALNGASFAAKRDNPGPCPGDGWQLMAAQGKRGSPGERGEHGPKGDRGAPGAALKSVEIDDMGMLRFINGDGSVVTCDLYPVLTKVVR